jgi:hypothetical protein
MATKPTFYGILWQCTLFYNSISYTWKNTISLCPLSNESFKKNSRLTKICCNRHA